eukprot:7417747-Alexandrium_andersonii.AAC.1
MEVLAQVAHALPSAHSYLNIRKEARAVHARVLARSEGGVLLFGIGEGLRLSLCARAGRHLQAS